MLQKAEEEQRLKEEKEKRLKDEERKINHPKDQKNFIEFSKKIFTGKLSKKQKILVCISIGWIVSIGYLTWWNGIKSFAVDQSFRWDEWIWFGVIPATVPYLLYFIWKKRD